MKSIYAQGQEMDLKSAPSSNVEQAVQKIHRAWLEAAPRRDIATIARLLPDSFIFTSNLFGVLNKTRFLEVIKSGELTFKSINRYDVTLSSFENMAVARGCDTVIARYKNRDISGHYRFTNVYVEQQGRWEVVSAHASYVGF